MLNLYYIKYLTFCSFLNIFIRFVSVPIAARNQHDTAYCNDHTLGKIHATLVIYCLYVLQMLKLNFEEFGCLQSRYTCINKIIFYNKHNAFETNQSAAFGTRRVL